MISLSDISGFEWDEGNQTKSWLKHQVSVGECEAVFFNLPLLLHSDPRHSQAESRYYVLGQTNEGRYLFIAFTVRSGNIHVISARDMSKKERELYDQANP
jgi:uncharacterized DUF497 family protein